MQLEFVVCFNGTTVNTVSSAKYLEFIIDNKLKFHGQMKVMLVRWLAQLEYQINKNKCFNSILRGITSITSKWYNLWVATYPTS